MRMLPVALMFALCVDAIAATYRTPNFIADAADAEYARQAAAAAEQSRSDLARLWLGRELPRWSEPCKLTVQDSSQGNGGVTRFKFDRGEVTGWDMRVFGTRQLVLSSVIPHEVTHTILACRYRQPLPRWFDEGCAAQAEHEVETRAYRKALRPEATSPAWLGQMLSSFDYPDGPRDMWRVYSTGWSIVGFLLEQSSHAAVIKFGETLVESGWQLAFERHYSIGSAAELIAVWSAWYGDRDSQTDQLAQTTDQKPELWIFTWVKCPPCQQFKTHLAADTGSLRTWTQSRFELRWIDIETEVGRRLMIQHGVKTVPTFMIHDGKRNPKASGYTSPEPFKRAVQQMLDKVPPSQAPAPPTGDDAVPVPRAEPQDAPLPDVPRDGDLQPAFPEPVIEPDDSPVARGSPQHGEPVPPTAARGRENHPAGEYGSPSAGRGFASWLAVNALPLVIGGGATGGAGLAAWAGLALARRVLRRGGDDRSGRSQGYREAAVIQTQSPPLPQRTTHETRFVPYELSDFEDAYNWAIERFGRDYPGSVAYAEAIDQTITAHLAARGIKRHQDQECVR